MARAALAFALSVVLSIACWDQTTGGVFSWSTLLLVAIPYLVCAALYLPRPGRPFVMPAGLAVATNLVLALGVYVFFGNSKRRSPEARWALDPTPAQRLFGERTDWNRSV